MTKNLSVFSHRHLIFEGVRELFFATLRAGMLSQKAHGWALEQKNNSLTPSKGLSVSKPTSGSLSRKKTLVPSKTYRPVQFECNYARTLLKFYSFGGSVSNKALTKVLASNGRRSLSCSPTPIKRIGSLSALAMAKIIPPLAVPSNLVIVIPVTPSDE